MKDRIKQCRITAKYSQKYVAISVGVATPTVSMWESGAKTPSIESLAKLADLFGTTVDYLIGRTDQAGNPLRQDPPMHADARQLLADYEALSPQGREYIRQQMAMALKVYPGESVSYPNVEAE